MSAIIDEEMVAKVARTLCCRSGCDIKGGGCGEFAACQAHTFQEDARAALAVAVPALLERCATAVESAVLGGPAETSAFGRGLRTGVTVSAGAIRSLSTETKA